MAKLPKIKDTVSEDLKKLLIGKTVGLDGTEDETLYHKIVGLEMEVVEFDGEKDNNYKVILDGEESYFIHSSAFDDFLNGENVGALLKSNDKGGTIVLINEKTTEMKKTTEEQIAYLKDFIIRWNAMEDLMDESERFLINGNLQSEYDSFLTDNELEALSADELLANLESFNQEEIESEEMELEEKNAFNDVDMFIEEYNDYLIGKQITYGKGEKLLITKVINFENSIGIELSNEDVDSFEIDYAENFIDGEEIHSSMGDIALLIQEKKETKEEEKPSSINIPENRYFVVNTDKMVILSGHEYQEDAVADYDYRTKNLGETALDIFNKRNVPVDPDVDSNWNLSLSDYSIIKEAIDFGVTEGDYDANAANAYFEKYKSESKFSSVIKARLVIYMEHADKHFKNAVISSQYEKALRFKETKEKLMNELLNIIKKDI